MSKFLAVIRSSLCASSFLCAAAHAEVYRWTDAAGRVVYSDSVPSGDAILVGADARGGFVSAVPLFLNERRIKRPAVTAEERGAETPARPRGLEFRRFVSLREGLSEGELLGSAGAPALLRRDEVVDVYTYMPTVADPFTTTIRLVHGRVSDLDRQRKF